MTNPARRGEANRLAPVLEEIDVGGWVAEGYEPVREAFIANFTDRGERGAAFAAVVQGEAVADLWAGSARDGVAWASDTVQIIFSGSKGLVGACVLALVEDGALALDAPVAEYWPEFAAGGKQHVLVRDVVTHQSGLPAVLTPLASADMCDWDRMVALLAAAEPFWPGERRLAYHALTYGWLCGELVRRACGRDVATVFAERFAAPLGIDVWLQLPRAQAGRAADVVLDPAYAIPPASEPRGEAVYGNPPFLAEPLPWNGDVRFGLIPAVGAFGEARGLARLYGCLAVGGTLAGVEVLTPSSVALGATCLGRGADVFFGDELAFGVGFQLQNEGEPFGSVERGFGHTGAGGSVHGAWPELATGFSYAMNELRPEASDDRGRSLLDALASVVQLHLTSALCEGEDQRGGQQHGGDEHHEPGRPDLSHQTMSSRSVLIWRNGTPRATRASSIASIITLEAQIRYS